MIVIDRYKYLSELTKLLSGMLPEDRDAVLADTLRRFESENNDDAVIRSLGSPTYAAVTVLRNYVPGEIAAKARQELPPEEEPDVEEAPAEEAPAGEPAPAEEEQEFPDIETLLEQTDGDNPPEPEPEETQEPENDVPVPEEPEVPTEQPAGRGVRPLVLIACILGGVIVALPVTLVLVALSLVIFAAGAVLAAGAFYCASFCFLGLTVVPDILLCAGAGLVLLALALPVLYLGVLLFVKGAIGFANFALRKFAVWSFEEVSE